MKSNHFQSVPHFSNSRHSTFPIWALKVLLFFLKFLWVVLIFYLRVSWRWLWSRRRRRTPCKWYSNSAGSGWWTGGLSWAGTLSPAVPLLLSAQEVHAAAALASLQPQLQHSGRLPKRLREQRFGSWHRTRYRQTVKLTVILSHSVW